MYLKLLHQLSSAPHTNDIRFDVKTELPLTPLAYLFKPAERIVLALLYRCQRKGLFRQSLIKLATPEQDLPLPSAWSGLTMQSRIARKGFPVGVYSAQAAEYLMRMIVDRTDTVPKNVTQFFELQDCIKKGFKHDKETVEGDDEMNTNWV